MSDFDRTSFTTDQISKWIWFVKKKLILMNVLLAENFYCNFLSRKTPTSAVICFLKNLDMEKKWIKTSLWMKTLEKNQILKEIFNNASDFESRFSKQVRFIVNFKQHVLLETEILQHVKFWNILFTTSQTLIRNFNIFLYNAPDF